MSSVVTTSENGLKMKIKRRSSTGKVISDVENIAGTRVTSPFKQKFILESDNGDKRKTGETLTAAAATTKLSSKILQAGKNKGKNKKQSKPLKEKKIKKRIHRVGSGANIGKCLSSPGKNSLECLTDGNVVRPNGTEAPSSRDRDDSARKDSTIASPLSVSDTFSRSSAAFHVSFDSNSTGNPAPKATEKQTSSTDKSTVATTRDVETETNHVGVITDPDCLGPCEPGTSVVLEGIVWNESDNGILVVNVTWRGKTYVGTLMDSTKHHWAPPRFSEEDLNGSTQYAHGGWGGTGHHHQKSRAEETAGETRKPRRCRKDAAALASHQSRTSKNSHLSNSAKENQPSAGNEIQSSKNKVGLFECQEENCSKKFKHLAGLRYHQSHAHCRKKEKDKSSASDSRSSPSGKSSEKHPPRTKTPEDASNKTSPVASARAPGSSSDPVPIVSKSNRPEVPSDGASSEALTETTKLPPPTDSFSSLKDEPKSTQADKDNIVDNNVDNIGLSLVKGSNASVQKTSSLVENVTKEAKPTCSEGKNTFINASPLSISRKEAFDLRVVPKEVLTSPSEAQNSSELKAESGRTDQPVPLAGNPAPRLHDGNRKHSSPQDAQRHCSGSSPSSSSNAKKHHLAPETFTSSKKLKLSEEMREEDHFYKAFRSMFENSFEYSMLMDPIYRAQAFPMIGDPLMFHKNLDHRNKVPKNCFDDLKPVDMSSKKTPTPKSETPSFWPTYLPSASMAQSSGHFFGPLKDSGSDVISRSLNENFSGPLPSPKDKSLPKLQRFPPTGRFLDPVTGGSKDEGPPLKGFERDFSYKQHKKIEEPSSQKNGKLKEDLRRPASSSYSKQDVFRSPLPPPLLPSSFPFFSAQHPGNYSSPHVPPYSLDPLEKPPLHPRHQSSHLSPTVGERFKFPNGMDPPPKQGGGGPGGGRPPAVSLSSKSHLEAPPPPKHHLHTHHHTHIIKTPYPMYTSLLTSPPIVPTVVVPEIFSPK